MPKQNMNNCWFKLKNCISHNVMMNYRVLINFEKRRDMRTTMVIYCQTDKEWRRVNGSLFYMRRGKTIIAFWSLTSIKRLIRRLENIKIAVQNVYLHDNNESSNTASFSVIRKLVLLLIIIIVWEIFSRKPVSNQDPFP